jgi:CHASE3 domain sensor protein
MKITARIFSPRYVIVLGLSVLVFLLLFVAGIQLGAADKVRDARRWIAHTESVQDRLLRLLLNAKDSQIYQADFLYSGKPAYLELRADSMKAAWGHFRALQTLAADPSTQKQNLDQLEVHLKQLETDFADIVILQRGGNHDRALLLHQKTEQSIFAKTENLVSQMLEIEAELLQQRGNIYEQETITHSRLSLSLLGLSLGCIVAMFFLLRQLERLQSIVKLCAWSNTIEYQGQWLSIADYLKRRFNLTITHGISDAQAEKFSREIDSME